MNAKSMKVHSDEASPLAAGRDKVYCSSRLMGLELRGNELPNGGGELSIGDGPFRGKVERKWTSLTE